MDRFKDRFENTLVEVKSLLCVPVTDMIVRKSLGKIQKNRHAKSTGTT